MKYRQGTCLPVVELSYNSNPIRGNHPCVDVTQSLVVETGYVTPIRSLAPSSRSKFVSVFACPAPFTPEAIYQHRIRYFAQVLTKYLAFVSGST